MYTEYIYHHLSFMKYLCTVFFYYGVFLHLWMSVGYLLFVYIFDVLLTIDFQFCSPGNFVAKHETGKVINYVVYTTVLLVKFIYIYIYVCF